MPTIGLRCAPLIGPNLSMSTNGANPTTRASAITAIAEVESRMTGNKIMELIATSVRNIDPMNSLNNSVKLECIKKIL